MINRLLAYVSLGCFVGGVACSAAPEEGVTDAASDASNDQPALDKSVTTDTAVMDTVATSDDGDVPRIDDVADVRVEDAPTPHDVADAGFDALDARADVAVDSGVDVFDARADVATDVVRPDVAADVERARPDGGWVQTARDGHLLYRADAQGNVVPDFSNAGYRGGGVRLPTVATRVTVAPVSGDATDDVQRAIDAVSAMTPDGDGFRGAVLLRAGTWRIAGTVHLRASGVVLRGEGARTVLLGTGRGQRTLIEVAGTGAPTELSGTRHAVADAYVPVGARTLRLAGGTTGLAVGTSVIVYRPSTAAWIHTLGMDAIPPRADGMPIVQWAPGTKDLRYERVITAIAGDAITLDAPVMNALQREYGGGSVYAYRHAGRIHEVGVESLAGDSEYASPRDEDHAWTFISLADAENAWVRDVTGRHFGYALVSAEDGAKYVTVQDCRHTDAISEITGGRRYAFNLNGGQYVLFQRDTVRDGRHDFVTHQTEAGPNVFLDCSSEQSYSEAGPHERWGTGTLFDNVRTAGTDASLAAYNRSNLGTGHGWSGAYQVFWNSASTEIHCESPPTAINWAIGCTATRRVGTCAWESYGTAVTPASLYRAQLTDRLGASAVTAIAR